LEKPASCEGTVQESVRCVVAAVTGTSVTPVTRHGTPPVWKITPAGSDAAPPALHTITVQQ
jgi:hypothetical protein